MSQPECMNARRRIMLMSLAKAKKIMSLLPSRKKLGMLFLD